MSFVWLNILKFSTIIDICKRKYCANFGRDFLAPFRTIALNKVTFSSVAVPGSIRGLDVELQSYIKLSELKRIWPCLGPCLNMNCLLLESFAEI